MSVFLHQPVKIDLPALRTSIGWAQSWTEKPVLCMLGDGWMRLMIVEEKRFLACWSYPLPEFEEKFFFLIPGFVAKTLSGPAVWEAQEMEVVVNRNIVGMILRDKNQQEFRIQWRWSAHDFEAPPYFRNLIQVPETVVKTSYIAIADIIHFAVHNLVNSTIAGDMLQTEKAILIDFTPGQLNIDGEAVTRSKDQSLYYFNPRMVMRGLEIVRERSIEVAIQNLDNKKSALYLNSHRDNWQIHCAILSVPVSNPQQMQQSNMTLQQTRPPMMDGSWFVPGT